MSELRTRDVIDADLPAVLSIRSRSFGPLGTGGETWWRRVSEETLGGRMIAVLDDSDRVVGAGRIRPYEQAWGGRHLRMGGVAGVYVEPSARGRGVATTLTRALITRMGELGEKVVLSRTRVSRLVDELARAGLVTRASNPSDRRSAYAELTAVGAERLRAAAPVYLAGIEELFSRHLTPSELRVLAGALWRIHEAHAQPAAP